MKAGWQLWGVFGLVVAFAVWLYWPTLGLPLIYDSLLHIRIADSLTWGEVWLPTAAFGFYRPMTFAPLLLVEGLFGRYPAGLLHASNVAQHVLNVVLLMWLGRRVFGRWQPGVAAGLLFAAFPFSYQAVAVYGHNVHPTIANLMLLGLHSYWWGLESKRPSTHLLTTLCFLLALLTHESAILFGPFAALLHWTHAPPNVGRDWRWLDPRRAPWVWYMVAGVAYLILYQFLPISGGPQAEPVAAVSYSFRLLYLLQGLLYPLVWLGNVLGLGTAVNILISVLIFILLLLWRGRESRNRYPILLGLGWAGLAYALIGVPLSTDYLLRGPRLLYLGGIGVCLLWSLIFVSDERRMAQWIGWGVVTAVLIINTLFVRQKLVQYAQLTEPLQLAQTAVSQTDDSGGVIFLNLPQWRTEASSQYPVGVELVSMLGGYLFVEELVNFNSDVPLTAQATFVAEQFADVPYGVGVHEQTTVSQIDWSAPKTQHIILTTYSEAGPSSRVAGRLDEHEAGGVVATFDPYSLLIASATSCEGVVTVRQQWRHEQTAVSPNLTLFVQGLGPSGQLVAQTDGPPLGIRADLLQTERPYTDIRTLSGEQPIQTVLVGVYDFTTGQRLPGVDGAERPLPNNAYPIAVTESCTE